MSKAPELGGEAKVQWGIGRENREPDAESACLAGVHFLHLEGCERRSPPRSTSLPFAEQVVMVTGDSMGGVCLLEPWLLSSQYTDTGSRPFCVDIGSVPPAAGTR